MKTLVLGEIDGYVINYEFRGARSRIGCDCGYGCYTVDGRQIYTCFHITVFHNALDARYDEQRAGTPYPIITLPSVIWTHLLAVRTALEALEPTESNLLTVLENVVIPLLELKRE